MSVLNEQYDDCKRIYNGFWLRYILDELNTYLRLPGYPTNYPIGYSGNKLPGYGSDMTTNEE